jgi:predicted RNase H-like HicB family nuclease
MSITVFWSEEDDGWIALDYFRPGCSAWGETEEDALKELTDAQSAWDGARAALQPDRAQP